jgi:hypothetical protein
MKIQIELVDDYGRTGRHLRTVANYISDKLIYTPKEGFLGLTMYNVSLPKIGGITSGSEYGDNIGTKNTKVFCHVSKTKGGIYKIKVWGE